MSGDDEEVTQTDHVFEFDFQDGWVDLGLEDMDWVEAWACATVVMMKHFDEAELMVRPRKLIRDLRRRALELNSDHANLATAYYTPDGRALAGLRLDSYGEDGVPRPSPKEAVPLLLDHSETDLLGEPDVRHLELPVGPAVRIRSTTRINGGFLGRALNRARRVECLRYAVFPPGVNSLSVVRVTWDRAEDTEFVTRLTDELVTTMRMTLVDEDGNPREVSGTD